MTAQMPTMAYATISGVSFLHLLSGAEAASPARWSGAIAR